MPLTPRYDGSAVIDVDSVVANPSVAVIRQRNRLADGLSQLSLEEWNAPSRCKGWSVQDVAEHVAGVNQFWVNSLGAGLRDEPTRLLVSFDPVKVPAAMVEKARGEAPPMTLERLAATNAELAALLESLSDDDWAKAAEAPPGHVSIRAVCAHALWDAWIHERDVLLPLGRVQPVEPDEVATALVYAAALGPAIYLNSGEERSGSLAVRACDPNLAFTVAVGHQVAVHFGALAGATDSVEGDAVDLVEGFSCRGPCPPVAPENGWLVDGLRRVFRAAD